MLRILDRLFPLLVLCPSDYLARFREIRRGACASWRVFAEENSDVRVTSIIRV